MCDRIYVMYEGRMIAEFPREEASQEVIMSCIMRENNKMENENAKS
jgi:putative multiple sugar transport system ATP-binding protein